MTTSVLLDHRRKAPFEAPELPPLPRACRDLMADAHRVLDRAMGTAGAADRFAAAHLAALRGAAAVLAMRAVPRRSARGSAWVLLARHSPELAEWAGFFASGARRRQAIVAGIEVAVTEREADDLVRAAAQFLDLVESMIGLHTGR